MILSSRCAGDDLKFIWMNGKRNLHLIDLETNQTSIIKNFWIFKEKGRPLDPFFIVANRDCSKIFAIGDDTAVDDSAIAIYREGSKLMQKNTYQITEALTFWACSEVSFDQKHLYIGGCSSIWAKIILVNFDEGLKVQSELELKMGDFKTVSMISRIQGTDIILGGCYKHIVVLRKANDTNAFSFLHSINVGIEDDFKRIAFHPKYIFALGEHDKMLTVARLTEVVSNEELYEVEHKWKKTINVKN